jgi:S-formylglutathione hydrolase FrmB
MRRLAGAFVCALAVLCPAGPAHAAQSCQLDAAAPEASPRIVTSELDGVPFDVLLPPGYASSARRHPVLYLLHGRQYSEHTWLRKSDVEELTAETGDRAPIVVMPTAGSDAWYFDYFDRSQQWERYLFERLIPHVDRTYRTLAGGSQRAIAGFSTGGLSAAYLASAHPEAFAAVGSFSGLVHLTLPEPAYDGPGAVEAAEGTGEPGSPRGPSKSEYKTPVPGCGGGDSLGDRSRDAWNWHAHNPTDLARNLRGLGVYAGAGNGATCGPDDASDPIVLAGAEPGILGMTEAYGAALTAAEVPHTLDRYPCGLHNMASASRALHRFWDLMLKSFGRAAPERFDFRSAGSEFEAWGWAFRADAKRAPEFLEVRGASADGLTLVGSGKTTLVTAGLFEPGQRVSVTGAAPASVEADADGRLTLAVDLGPPNATAQFSSGGGGRAVVARRVRFSPGGGSEPTLPGGRDCSAGTRLKVRMPRLRARERRVSVAIAANGRRVFVRRGRAARRLKRVLLGDLPRGSLRLALRVKTTRGRILRSSRSYPACAA